MTVPTRRDRPRRSLLALPGSSERFLKKATSLPADALVIDLEDAVAPSAKEAARRLVAQAIAKTDYGERVVSVRVNGWGSGGTLEDLRAVVSADSTRLDSIALPKTASAGEVVALDLVLSDLERAAGLEAGRIGIDVLIESAAGLASVETICAASARVWSVALGRADLAASLGMPALVGGAPAVNYPGDHFHYVLFRVLVAARAAGIAIFDGPYLHLEDSVGLAELARRAATLGYDGKWAIHPDQLDTVNAAFTPGEAELARARAVLERLEAAERHDGRGATRDGAEMLDEASRKMALALVARASNGHGER